MITFLFLIYILFSVNVDVVLKANETESETHYQFLSLGNIVLSKLETSVCCFAKNMCLVCSVSRSKELTKGRHHK